MDQTRAFRARRTAALAFASLCPIADATLSRNSEAGAGFGLPGTPGKVIVAIGDGSSEGSIVWTSARTTPPGALSVGELGPSILQRAVELDNDAVQKGFQRRSGRAR